ncbi:MAG: zinc ribbon domain-containing protein [Eubacterium sp.]|jgi:hypothetical protein|nr:zinc ribbon domain-containing protein [Eubacterium sp.]
MAIYCPDCGKEYEDGVTLCAECGAIIDGEPHTAADKDVPTGEVDNSDAISKMFEEAKNKINTFPNLAPANESIPVEVVQDFQKGEPVDISLTATGGAPDIPLGEDLLSAEFLNPEFDESFFDEQEEEESEPKPDGVTVKIAQSNPEVIYEMPGSAAEAAAIAAAEVAKRKQLEEMDEESDAATAKKNVKSKAKKNKEKKQKKSIIKADKNIDDTDVDQSINPNTVSIRVKQEQTNDIDPDSSETNGRISLNLFNNKNAKTKMIAIMTLVVIVSIVIGGASTYLYIDGQYKNGIYGIAYDSVNDVAQRLPKSSRFIVYDVYVKESRTTVECVINGAVSSSVGEYTPTYYRIVSDGEKKTLYKPFDQNEYERLMGGSKEEKIQARINLGWHKTYLAAIDEINSGSGKWKRANAGYINMLRLGDVVITK